MLSCTSTCGEYSAFPGSLHCACKTFSASVKPQKNQAHLALRLRAGKLIPSPSKCLQDTRRFLSFSLAPPGIVREKVNQQHSCHRIVYLRKIILPYGGPGSVDGIATAYGLDGRGIESRWGRDFPHQSRPAMRPAQPPGKWLPGFSRGQGAAGA